METTATVNEAGVLTLPLEICERFQLKPGDEVKVNVDSSGLPVEREQEPEAEPYLVEEDGVMVIQMPEGVQQVDAVTAIQLDRQDREDRILEGLRTT